eukprot:CFRG7937T1
MTDPRGPPRHGAVPVVMARSNTARTVSMTAGPSSVPVHHHTGWTDLIGGISRPHSNTLHNGHSPTSSMYQLDQYNSHSRMGALHAQTSGLCSNSLHSRPSDTAQLDNICDFVGMYDFKGTIGKGHYGTVKLAVHVITKEKVAVKQISKFMLDENTRERLYLEIRVMKLLKHSHIIGLYEVAETPNDLFLILEYAPGGDLYDYVLEKGPVEEKRAKKYFCQILSAVMYCHQLNVTHRDIKPENILFAEGNHMLKISDFGMSAQIDAGDMLKTGCGTMAYSAPEILKGEQYVGPRVDVWSLGVTLYYLVVGRLPFDNRSPTEAVTDIIMGRYELDNLEKGVKLSKKLKSLIRAMLHGDAEGRATMESIVEHPWLENKFKKYYQTSGLSNLKLNAEEEIAVKRDVAALGLNMEELEKDLSAGVHSHLVATYRLLADQKLRNRDLQRLDESTRTIGGISRQNIIVPPGSPRQVVRQTSSQDFNNLDVSLQLKAPSSGSLTRARSCEELSSTSLLDLNSQRPCASQQQIAQVASMSVSAGLPYINSSHSSRTSTSSVHSALPSIYSNQNAITQMTTNANGDIENSPSLRRCHDQAGEFPAGFIVNRITTQSVPELRPMHGICNIDRNPNNLIVEDSVEDIYSYDNDQTQRFDENLFAEEDEPTFEFAMPSFLKRRSISALPGNESFRMYSPSPHMSEMGNLGEDASGVDLYRASSTRVSPVPPQAGSTLAHRKAVSLIREESHTRATNILSSALESNDVNISHHLDMREDTSDNCPPSSGCLGRHNCCTMQ